MSKFKVGDRVRCVMGYDDFPPEKGWTGTVYRADEGAFLARWDQNPNGETLDNACKNIFAELIEPIEQPKPMPTTNNDHIEQQLLAILNGHVPTDAYLAAENKARKVEKEEGTLTDLRSDRDWTLDAVRDLAGYIAKLRDTVNDINGR